jgi:hypothetical protein
MRFIFSLIIFFNSFLFAQSNSLILTSNNSTKYKIVISSKASHWDSLSATELQHYIKEISDVVIPIQDDNSKITDFEIIIGENKHSFITDKSRIFYDGFRIKTKGNKINLLGGENKGTLNSVYSFLEYYLGCRLYSSEVKLILKNKTITIPQIDILENPVFTYREPHYYEPTKENYAHWHKLIDSEDKKMWGMFVHTFQFLLPADKYFKEHPEYFALRNNRRVPQEPCLSNSDVYKIMVEELRKRMAANPSAKYWSVSQNDDDDFCQCDKCRKIDEHEDSPSGSIINFVNKIAKEFPDKIISTLAYRYSRKAPKFIKPEKNVNIMLCTIECFRTNPLDKDETGLLFVNDLADWSKITDNIFLWDYVVQFSNLISPFPNFQVLQPNIQLFAKHGVKMMFQQGAGGSRNTEFGELRTYLISKLLWNPNINIDSVMNDFLSCYYGKAGKFIREYIDLMHDELIKSKAKLWIYSNPVEQMNDFLKPELMDKYNLIFDKAEESVASESLFLERVKLARAPLIYAMLEQAKVLRTGDKSILIRNSENELAVNSKINLLLSDFLTTTTKVDNVLVNEKSLTPEKYVSRYKTMLSKLMYNPLGLNKPVTFLTEPNYKYPANREKTLTDGIRGDEDHLFNWLGFEGNDMEAIIDLQEVKSVKKVSADFLQNVFSWIFLPEELEISISPDGNSFSKVSLTVNTTPITKEELASPIFAFIQNFNCEFDPVETRFIKVKATNIKICPGWHPGYPLKAWIFTDEIVIE